MNLQKLIFSALFSLTLVIAGCSSSPETIQTVQPNKLSPEQVRQVAQLETIGMKLLQQGDRLTVIIPTDYYFESQSTTVDPDHEKGLIAVAQFVKNFANQYPNSVIRVTGYTDKVMSPADQIKFSQKYAESIGAFLFNAGIPKQRLAILGRGSSEPIANESQPGSMAMNRRVVIRVN